MTVAHRSRLQWLTAIGMLVALSLVSFSLPGCGGKSSPEGSSEDEKKIQDLVYDLADHSDDEKAFNEFFVTPPANRDAYRNVGCLDCKITVEGDSATMIVDLLRNDISQERLGEMQWKAKKVGDTWKIAEAPLP